MIEYSFEDIVNKKKGFLRGPFGGDLKKEIFVPKGEDTYKVYEQSVVLRNDPKLGRYHISKEYFDQKMHRFEVRKNDFLVSCSGVNYGAIIQLKNQIEPGVINQALLRIRLNNDIVNDDYFYYFFKHHIVNQIIGRKGDSTIPNFPALSVIKKLRFSLPDLNTQKITGDALSTLDEKIALNNRINTELEGMAKLLYDYWFVQFDFPDENGQPYKSSGGKMVYNARLKREIPVGWGVKELGDVAEIKAGGDRPEILSSTKTEVCNVPIYSNGITNEGLYGYTDKAKVFKQSITVTGRGANVGYSVLRNTPFLPIIRLLVITPQFPYYSKFLYERVKDLNFQNSGSAQPQITVPQISSLPILMPNSGIIKKYDVLTSSGVKAIENNKEQNRKLSELRDWLLPMLMNGQVRVGE